MSGEHERILVYAMAEHSYILHYYFPQETEENHYKSQ
jgi:hypothetical protein